MKVINLDELEIKCLEYGIKQGFFTKEDLCDKNLVSIYLKGDYHNKECEIWITGNREILPSGNLGFNRPIRFNAKTWEDLYYQIWEFFR